MTELESLEMWLKCTDDTKNKILQNTIGREINGSDILVEYGSQCVQDKAFEEWMQQFHELQVEWKEKK